MDDILFNIDTRGCAQLTLNREATHNAFDDGIIAQLQTHLDRISTETTTKLLVLAAKGKSFSSGADLNWMSRMAEYSEEENFQDAMLMAKFFETLSALPIPTLAVIQGAAFGGGLGLVAACDIALASNSATFGMPEVKLGLIPAVIFPYIRQAMGPRAAQRYALTGETFNAEEAQRLGLVHRVAALAELEEATMSFTNNILKNGPNAMTMVKTSLSTIRGTPATKYAETTSRLIAKARMSEEGKEGIKAFLEKRQPKWKPRDV